MCVAYLESLFAFQAVVSRRRQIEESNAVVVYPIMLILIAHCERVIFTDLVIKSRAQIHAHAWISYRIAEISDIKSRIENFCADNGEVVDIPALEIKEKRRLLGQWAANASAELRGLVTRRLHAWRSHFERVARIESRGIPGQK